MEAADSLNMLNEDVRQQLINHVLASEDPDAAHNLLLDLLGRLSDEEVEELAGLWMDDGDDF